MVPATPIGGWGLQFIVQKHFGGLSGLIVKSAASGYGNGQSGITVTNSGQGMFNVKINSQDTEPFSFEPLAYSVLRTDSGSVATLAEGFVNILPTMG